MCLGWREYTIPPASAAPKEDTVSSLGTSLVGNCKYLCREWGVSIFYLASVGSLFNGVTDFDLLMIAQVIFTGNLTGVNYFPCIYVFLEVRLAPHCE